MQLSCVDHTFVTQNLNMEHQLYTYTCESRNRDIFLGVLYGYKAALQIVALVLSFGIRKVKVKGLDDSKYIAAAVYVTSIVLAVVIVGTYTLNGLLNGFPALISIGTFVGTTFILLLVFIPKVSLNNNNYSTVLLACFCVFLLY